MSVDLTRTDENLFDMPPLTWRMVESDGKLLPIMRDSCEALHHARLDTWTIAADGMVTPSVHFLDCGWHNNVKLLGWAAS